MKVMIVILLFTAATAMAQPEPVQDSYVIKDDYWGRIVYYDCNLLDMPVFMERVLYYAQVVLPETEYLQANGEIYGHRQIGDNEELIIRVVPYTSIRFIDQQNHYVSITIYGENWRGEKLQPESFNILYEKAADFIEEVISIAKSCYKDPSTIK